MNFRWPKNYIFGPIAKNIPLKISLYSCTKDFISRAEKYAFPTVEIFFASRKSGTRAARMDANALVGAGPLLRQHQSARFA